MEEKTSKTVHHVLSYSYTSFFFGLIFGLILDYFLRIKIFPNSDSGVYGFLVIFIGSIIVLWAQRTTGVTQVARHDGDLKPEDFMHGPYKYSRSPTHIGLTILSLGVGIVMNSSVMVLICFVSSVVSHAIFLNQQDKILESKYGEPYKIYKKTVSRWF